MLALATEFIDRFPQLGDAFFEHAKRAAEDSSGSDVSVQDRESYSDDQDRANYVSDEGPGVFEVNVCRVGYGHATLRIAADDVRDARLRALDEAGDHEYSEAASEYTVEGVTRVGN